MSAFADNDAQFEGGAGASAAAAERPAAETLLAVRDTLIVLSMQIVFRATMFLRHLNY